EAVDASADRAGADQDIHIALQEAGQAGFVLAGVEADFPAVLHERVAVFNVLAEHRQPGRTFVVAQLTLRYKVTEAALISERVQTEGKAGPARSCLLVWTRFLGRDRLVRAISLRRPNWTHPTRKLVCHGPTLSCCCSASPR